MTILRALIRVVIVALSIWIGQSLLIFSTKTGLWAMVSLGIAAALAGILLIRYVLAVRTRGQEALVQFATTGILLQVYYLLVPRSALAASPDMVLALGVAAVSGLFEWVVPDRLIA